MLKTMLKAIALAGGLLIPGVALAVPAMVTTDLNVRAGPGAQHQRIATIPSGHRVEVDGCLRGYNWCRVVWPGPSGWVSGSYLAYLDSSYGRAPLPDVGLAIGVPIIAFDYGRDRYWRHRHWRDRDWDDWRDRHHWRDRRDWDRSDRWDRHDRRDRDRRARRDRDRGPRDVRRMLEHSNIPFFRDR